MALDVEPVPTRPDGCVGYLLSDPASREALALDPRMDEVERFLERSAAKGVRILHVLDTHTHADHLSGARELAKRTGAALLAHPKSRLAAAAPRLEDGAALRLGAVEVRILHTPGHTPDSLSVLADGRLFTGDALFTDGAGRTDFPGGSASELFDSFRRIEALPDATEVRPGHDYAGRPSVPLGEAKRANRLLAERDRDALVRAMDREGAPPAGMEGILAWNTAAAVVDVRTPGEFAGRRIPGSVNLPLSDLDARAAEVPEGALLVCATGARAGMAARRLKVRTSVLPGGISAWAGDGLPLEGKGGPLPVDRQVQLVVGTGVLAGVLLGAFVHPGFLVLAGFFGAGLAFAGLSGTCGMAMLLMKAPWNRGPAAPPGGAACAVGGGAPKRG